MAYISIPFLAALTFSACHSLPPNQTQMSPHDKGEAVQGQALEQLRLSPFVLAPNLELKYEAYVHNGFQTRREDFDIKILDTWEAGVSFAYRAFSNGQSIAEGVESLSSLDNCDKIDPWWDPAMSHHDDRCELWISQQDYISLMAEDAVYLAIDTQARGDVVLAIRLTAEGLYPCEVNGVMLNLPVVQASSQRGDELVLLADPQNPLILSLKSSYFSWEVRSIRQDAENSLRTP